MAVLHNKSNWISQGSIIIPSQEREDDVTDKILRVGNVPSFTKK